MSANIKVSGKVYNGIETISVKDTSDAQVNFLLQGATPTPAPVYKENDVTFIDYDGAIVISYTKTEFLALTAMPDNPTHTGLVADGWNYTLSDAKSYVASYGKLKIGQMYHTASGKTEYDTDVNEASGMTATLGLIGTEKDWGDGTVDTNISHTYATAGRYTIKLSGTTLPSISSSKKVRAVRIANGVTNIGDSAFKQCYPLRSVAIPSSVTSIGDSAFISCRSLRFVTIPNSVTSIGSDAFSLCGALQFVSIPISLTSIGSDTFQYGRSFQSVSIPSSVTSIGIGAFDSGISLQSVTIPIGVTNIGSAAFQYCSSLQSVTIPSSVTSISDRAFGNCTWLTIMTVLATTPPTLANTNAIPSTVTKIYIPNGTLATYQGASNWSSFSSLFVELPA